MGGRGLTLVRLLTINQAYRWTGASNHLSLDLPLAGTAETADRGADACHDEMCGLSAWQRLHALWSSNLALRLTVVFTLCAMTVVFCRDDMLKKIAEDSKTKGSVDEKALIKEFSAYPVYSLRLNKINDGILVTTSLLSNMHN